MAISKIVTNSVDSGAVTLTTQVTGILPVANGGSGLATKAGTILQVVNFTYATATSNSTSTPASTGLTLSITPISTSSRILVIANIASVQNNNSGNGVNLQLLRNATVLYTFGTVNGYTNSAITTVTSGGGTTFIDAPATISATSYTVYFASNTGAGQIVTVQANNATSTMTLMEIAG